MQFGKYLITLQGLFLIRIALCLAGAVPAAFASVPVGADIPLDGAPAQMLEDWPEWRWRMLAGDDAFSAGLPWLAERFYREGLDKWAVQQETRNRLKVKLAAALIAQRRFTAAGEILDQVEPPYSDAYYLRRVIVAFVQDQWPLVEDNLDRIDIASLPRAEAPWYYLMRGLLQRWQGDQESSDKNLETALETAGSPAQRALMEASVFRWMLVQDQGDESDLDLLAEKLQENEGTRAGFNFARQYAVMLERFGRRDEALRVLQDQMKFLTADESEEKNQMLLLISLIAGEDTRRGQLALEEILGSTGNRSTLRLALYLLARSQGDAAAGDNAAASALIPVLDRLIADENHVIRDEMLALRSRLHLDGRRSAEAMADAEELLQRYPGSGLRRQAIWTLAYLAWTDSPPRLRTAADNLMRLRSELPPGEENLRLGRLIGDCYFLNGDYATAARIYDSVLSESQGRKDGGPLVFQLLLCHLNQNALDEARRTMDRAFLLAQGSDDYLWRGEWNLLHAMFRAGLAEEAYDRLSYLLYASEGASLSLDLRLRFQWLEARLAESQGEHDRVIELTNEILQALDAADAGDQLDSQRHSEIASYVLLLQGQAYLRAGMHDEGLAVLEDLRGRFEGSDPAILSYLEESRYFAGQMILADAQRRLVELAGNYSDSQHAPAALFEAALIADQVGLQRNREEALAILATLVENYPGHPLEFHARLLQADISRKLNRFGAAQLIYETLIKEHPRHPESHLAELYLADTLLAQSTRDPANSDAAAAVLERLLDRPNLPPEVQAEAGYKLGLIFLQRENPVRAAEHFWLLLSRFLNDPVQAAELGPRGRYWISRTVLELGSIMQRQGRTADARDVYRLIARHGLPGEQLARARMESLLRGGG